MLLPLVASAYDFEKDGIYYNITSLQDLTVEVTSGDIRYEGNATIPATVEYSERTFNVTRIGAKAFEGCNKLNNINIPLSVLYIREYAFSGCSQLYELSIPSSVKSIGSGCFTGCYNLSVLRIEDGDEDLSISYKEYQVYNFSSFLDCSLGYVYIGRNISGVNGEPDYHAMFFNQSNLKTIEIGKKVTRIGDFVNCSGLENILIPDNVKTICRNAFYECTNLKNIKLQEGVQEIMYSAFRGCKSLEKVVIPSTISSIADGAFLGCTSITKVYSKITEPFDIAESTFAGITYLNSVLYVPVGTKILYQEKTGWKDFVSIEETDDFDSILNFYSANISVSNGGSVECYGINIANTNMSITIKDGNLNLQILPDDTYRLASLIVDGNDVTESVADGVYTIKEIKSDIDINVSFIRYFDVGHVVKVVNIIMNGNASTNDVTHYDLNSDGELNIGDVILIVKNILDSDGSILLPSNNAGELADFSRYTAAQFELKTGNTHVNNIRLVDNMKQTHKLSYRQTDEGTYTVVIFSSSNKLLIPDNNNIIVVETEEGVSEKMAIRNITFSTPTGEISSYQDQQVTTSIQHVINNDRRSIIYDLKGQRRDGSKGKERGIYIINGKKVVVK